MNISHKRVAATLETLEGLGVLSKEGLKYKVTTDFDLVVRGLMVKRLKRIVGNGTKEQVKHAETEAFVDALQAYGFLNITQKPADVEVAVNCLLTFKKEAQPEKEKEAK
jgi:hypothetical protein